VKIVALVPGSFATAHLGDKKIINMYLLAINGVPIHTASDISDVIDDILDRIPEEAHCALSGFNFLFGTLTDEEQHNDLFLQAPDHATSRVVMAIALLDPKSTIDEVTFRSCDQFPTYFHLVSSIHPNQMETCPSSFGRAMQDPIHRAQWRESLFSHLARCYSMGTYGCPTIPPPGAMILPAVIVLKLVLTQLKQATLRKTRVCVNGSVQIQGRDYEESYTPTLLLAPSTKILLAVACYLDWQLFHFDVHNAFQSTPDPGDIHGNRAYLRINREWLEYIKLHKPEWWIRVKELLQTNSIGDLAVEMFMSVQGRVDASLMWAIEVEDFISNDLHLLANRADPCVYSGTVNNEPVILGRATDDFLCACKSLATYDYIVERFRTKWKIHSLGLVRTFFGLNFVATPNCITVDQTDKCEKIITQVFRPSWRLQKPKGSYNIPMKAGSKYAEMLARSPPLSDDALATIEVPFGFKYRSVLGACVHLAIWTRLDILLTCILLAQFQTSTGVEHFEALKHLVGYLRRNPDVPLTYCRQRFDASVPSLRIKVNETDALGSEIFSSASYHVGSVDLITRTQDLIVASTLLSETKEAWQVLTGAIRDDDSVCPTLQKESEIDADILAFPESVDDPI
jgi:hypothetical protein